MLAPLALTALLLGGDDSLLPNYAARLLSPVEDRDYAPRLFPARRTLPIRVGVVADPMFVTDDQRSIVQEACAAWAAATRSSTGPGLTFAYVPVRRIGDAEIAFAFGRPAAGTRLTGLTLERGGWASIDLAVEDGEGEALPRESVRRTATHELGHALGIWGHSPDAGDIMAVRPQTDGVSRADVNTLRIAYR